MDGSYSLSGQPYIKQDLSKRGESFEYGPGGERYERAVGATPQIQSPDRDVGATSQIQAPLNSLDDVDTSKSVPTETSTNPYEIIENEIPLSHPRQEESRLLQHLLTN